jgi:hypothetical protein
VATTSAHLWLQWHQPIALSVVRVPAAATGSTAAVRPLWRVVGMDYLFIPGRTPTDALARDVYARRPNTQRIERRGMLTLEHFIDHVSNDPNIQTPLDELLICTHGSEEGFMQIGLDANSPNGTTFEALDDADHTGAIRLLDVLFIPDGGGNPPRNFFRVVGCNVGKAAPFVEKLRHALGDNMRVIAARHSFFVSFGRAHGGFEFLGYEFQFSTTNFLRNRAQILAEFQNRAFQFYDGTPVPAASFDNWIPRRLSPAVLNEGRRGAQALVISPPLGQAIGNLTRLNTSQFILEHFSRTYTYRFGLPQDPGSNTARRAALQNSLTNNVMFQAAHPFPVYARFGYQDLNGFVNGWSWNFDFRNHTLSCHGTRHDYRLIVPVLDRQTNNLLFNFYPAVGTNFAAIQTLPFNNAALFYATA